MSIVSMIVYTILGNFALALGWLFVSPTTRAFARANTTNLSDVFSALGAIPTYWAKGGQKVPAVLEKISSYLLTKPDKLLTAPITWITLLAFVLVAFSILSWFLTEEKTKVGLAIWLSICANFICLEAFFL